MRMKSLVGILLVLCLLIPVTRAEETRTSDEKPDVDLVICLDTSGSMEGLIDSARQKLWDIVNEMLNAKPLPNLRVALVTYGDNAGAIVVQTDLTTDLDALYQKLMALTTDGGEEYVGEALHTALTKLSWSQKKDAFRLCFIAGNESADQNVQNFDYRKICKDAVAKDVFVNTIYCSAVEDDNVEQIALGWRDVAKLGNGEFTSINMNGTVHIETPMDAELIKLSEEINTTYIAFGKNAERGRENQKQGDELAKKEKGGSAVAAERAACKANCYYKNESWDMVDACNAKDFDWEKLKDEDLPENMKKMNVEERKKYVQEQADKRSGIQKKINDVNAKRSEYVQNEMKKVAGKEQAVFDEALKNCIHKQAGQKNIRFEKSEKK